MPRLQADETWFLSAKAQTTCPACGFKFRFDYPARLSDTPAPNQIKPFRSVLPGAQL